MAAAALARAAPQLRATDSLEDAVHALAATDDDGAPVLDEHGRLIGWLTHRRVLRAYRERSRHNQPALGAAPSGEMPEERAA